MQRFKKEMMKRANMDAFSRPRVFGKAYGWSYASPYANVFTGKFEYETMCAAGNRYAVAFADFQAERRKRVTGGYDGMVTFALDLCGVVTSMCRIYASMCAKLLP